jgi:transposase InsO family protein
MCTTLVEDALKAANLTRGACLGPVFHSDHESHLQGLRDARRRLGVTQSMGAVGSSADDALAESFNAALEREVLQEQRCWPNELTCGRGGRTGPMRGGCRFDVDGLAAAAVLEAGRRISSPATDEEKVRWLGTAPAGRARCGT